MDNLAASGSTSYPVGPVPASPWRGPGAAPPDFVRLATMLELYAPDGAPQAAGAPQGAGAPSNAQPPPPGSDGININRPPDGGGGSSSSSGPGASSAASRAQAAGAFAAPPLKRLLHDDLLVLRHPDVSVTRLSWPCPRARTSIPSTAASPSPSPGAPPPRPPPPPRSRTP